MTVVMDGKKVAKRVIEEMEKELALLSKKKITPQLAIVRVGEDSSSIAYEKSAQKKQKRSG